MMCGDVLRWGSLNSLSCWCARSLLMFSRCCTSFCLCFGVGNLCRIQTVSQILFVLLNYTFLQRFCLAGTFLSLVNEPSCACLICLSDKLCQLHLDSLKFAYGPLGVLASSTYCLGSFCLPTSCLEGLDQGICKLLRRISCGGSGNNMQQL